MLVVKPVPEVDAAWDLFKIGVLGDPINESRGFMALLDYTFRNKAISVLVVKPMVDVDVA